MTSAHPETLVIEKPGKDQSSYPRKNIPEKDIVSESWLLMFVHAIVILTKWKKISLQNEVILQQVLADNHIQFDYNSAIRILIAQKNVFGVLLEITHKPKKVIIECPYTIMGYVWSLHKKGIPVIELQHGVLNDKHYAYNSLYSSPILYPDEICVFGQDEYEYLNGQDCHYCKKIHKTGLFFMELAKQSFTNDPLKEFRSKYEKVILVAGQRGYEEAMAEYVKGAARKTSNCLYVYVPRNTDAGLVFDQDNIVYRPGVNIYEYMIFKKAHWNLETDKNVRAAVSFFKELPIPASLAGLVKEINMDGSDEIYMQIAPEWDGRDERFDFRKVTKAEMEQFPNLKKMLIFGNERDAESLRKVCAPLGIEVEPMACTSV